MFVEYPQTSSRTFVLNSNKNVVTTELNIKAVLKDHQSGDEYPLLVTPSSVSVSPNAPSSFAVDYDCSKTNGTHSIVKVSISDFADFEYVKQCHEIPDEKLMYFISAVSLLLIATATLAIGVKLDRLEMLNGVREADMYEIESITVWQVLGLVCLASTTLFTFYVLITWFSLTWFITIFFMCSCGGMMVPLFNDVISYYAQGNVKSICNLKLCNSELTVNWCVSLCVTIAILCSWYFTRNWVLNDVIGCTVVCGFLKVVRLNKLTPGLLILSGLFLYDIFWVYLSGYVFRGESVMIVVATSIDIPAKLVFSGWNVFSHCTLIGLGDLVVPGFYISFVSRFGDQAKTQAYYVSHLCAYFSSILLCIFVISLGFGGQPALLYIVPALFLSTFAVGYRRGEIQKLFEGVESSHGGSNEESNYSDGSNDQNINLDDVFQRKNS